MPRWNKPEDLPAILMHMTMAIFDKLGGTERKRFLGAYDISRHQLVSFGYLKKGSETGPITNVVLTSRGHTKNRPHRSEGAMKKKRFLKLYERYQAAIEAQENTKVGDVPQELPKKPKKTAGPAKKTSKKSARKPTRKLSPPVSPLKPKGRKAKVVKAKSPKLAKAHKPTSGAKRAKRSK